MIENRYDRQRRFGPIGDAGQTRIERTRVLIVGAGALGSVVAELLARAGVGFLRIADRDTVEWTNLQRQSLYTEADAVQGLAKVHAAAARLVEINSGITIDPIACDVTAHNIHDLTDQVDLIVDGTDNFETRFLMNDIAWKRGIPWVHGGCVGGSGQVFAFEPGKTICFRCLVPAVPDPSSVATCDTAGVLGPATHVIASLQAMEVLKIVVDTKTDSRVKSFDFWEGKYRMIETGGLRDGKCPVCDSGRYDFLSGDAGAQPTVLCGRNAVQLPPPISGKPLMLGNIAEHWHGLGKIDQNKFLVRLNIDNQQSITLFRDGRAVIGGTEDPVEAKMLYARYVGN